MKKLLLLVFAIAFMSCEKKAHESGYGKATFYITHGSGDWALILDGVQQHGKLKKVSQSPLCPDYLLTVKDLTVGAHTADAKSLSGFAWGQPKTFYVESGGCVNVPLP